MDKKRKKQKIGLFGGTFNPIHIGHLQLAQFAVESIGLAKVYFLPASTPPHKDNSNIISFAHRLTMVDLACKLSHAFVSSDVERYTSTPSYTIDTLRAMKKNVFKDEDTELYFIIGVDAFLEIKDWNNYRLLLAEVKIIICPRHGFSHQKLYVLLDELGYGFEGFKWLHKTFQNIFVLEQIPANISSTLIRDYVARQQSLDKYLPLNVASYIKRKKLY
ncbi:MAG: nicotinate (nicotinamide) nucleotide adenylyltransferase [Desulfotalea sp.]